MLHCLVFFLHSSCLVAFYTPLLAYLLPAGVSHGLFLRPFVFLDRFSIQVFIHAHSFSTIYILIFKFSPPFQTPHLSSRQRIQLFTQHLYLDIS